MRLLAIADRPPKQSILKTLKEHEIDVIVTLGDLSRQDLFELEQIITIPKLGVYGNHCSGNYFDGLGIQNLHLKTFDHQGVTFGGFQGSVRYKESPHAIMYTQEEAQELLKDFPRVDIMLAHCPPYGINDEPDDLTHQGLQALRTYIEEQQPAYFLHGHTYPTEATIVHKHMQTEIVYVFEDKIIEVNC